MLTLGMVPAFAEEIPEPTPTPRAYWSILAIPASNVLVLEEIPPYYPLSPGSESLPDVFSLHARDNGEIVGTARPITWDREETRPRRITARLLLHERNRLVREGDAAEALSLDGSNNDFPGRVDLLQSGNRRFSSRYKHMAYYGPLHGDGGTLDRGEILIDPLYMLQYGLTDRITLKTAHTGYLLGVANAGAKVEAFRDDTLIFTPSLEGIYYTKTESFAGSARMHFTFLTNTRFMNHFSGTVLFDPASRLREKAGIGNVVSTQLEAMTEAVLDDWNRVIFGPIYNFELKTVGGFASYFWVANRIHVGGGVRTQDFSKLRLRPEDAYSPTFTIFWRI